MKDTKDRTDDLTARLRDPGTVRAAFAEMVEEYSRPLYWQIRRMVLNADDTDDLLQNTFMKAWNSLENFRGEAKLSTWLHKIAINEAISFLEKEKRRGAMSLDDPDGTVASTVAAGGEFIGVAASAGADAYVTADVRYHDFCDNRSGMAIFDIGHFESEACSMAIFASILDGKIPVYISQSQKNPVKYII